MKICILHSTAALCAINAVFAGSIAAEALDQSSKSQQIKHIDLVGLMEGKFDTSKGLRDRSYSEGRVRLAAGKETIAMFLDWKRLDQGSTAYYQCVYIVDKLNINSAILVPRSEILRQDSKVDCPSEVKFSVHRNSKFYSMKIEYTSGEFELQLQASQDWLTTTEAGKPQAMSISGIDFSSDYRKIKANLEANDFTLRETYFQRNPESPAFQVIYAYRNMRADEIRTYCNRVKSSGINPEQSFVIVFPEYIEPSPIYPIFIRMRSNPLPGNNLLRVEAQKQLAEKYGQRSIEDESTPAWYFSSDRSLFTKGEIPGTRGNTYGWFSRGKNGLLTTLPNDECNQSSDRRMQIDAKGVVFSCDKDHNDGRTYDTGIYQGMALPKPPECAFTITAELRGRPNLEALDLYLTDRQSYVKYLNDFDSEKIDRANRSDLTRALESKKNRLKL